MTPVLGMTLTEATAIALATGACVQHGDLVMRPLVHEGKVFYVVGDGLMPVTKEWVPGELSGDLGWQVLEESSHVGPALAVG